MNKEMQKRRDKFAWVDKMGGGHIRQDVQLGWDKCAEIYEKEKVKPLVKALEYISYEQPDEPPIRNVDKYALYRCSKKAKETLKRLGFKDDS